MDELKKKLIAKSSKEQYVENMAAQGAPDKVIDHLMDGNRESEYPEDGPIYDTMKDVPLYDQLKMWHQYKDSREDPLKATPTKRASPSRRKRMAQTRSPASEVKLPDGWGRSVVGGREIITKPSAPAVAAPRQHGDPSEMESIGGGNTYGGMESFSMPDMDIVADSSRKSDADNDAELNDRLDDLYRKLKITDIGSYQKNEMQQVYHTWDELESNNARSANGGVFNLRQLAMPVGDISTKGFRDTVQEDQVYIRDGVIYYADSDKPYYGGGDAEMNDDHVRRLLGR